MTVKRIDRLARSAFHSSPLSSASWTRVGNSSHWRGTRLDAPDLATQQRIAADVQVHALNDVTFIPLGVT